MRRHKMDSGLLHFPNRRLKFSHPPSDHHHQLGEADNLWSSGPQRICDTRALVKTQASG
ncbi:hypothetical protein BDQ12DRAFT_49574 [Crucibulum laeve]|uniref:Uncharacterized protein n=1 Tax=Crucibulum laeve TaxID=68775 RepID=A0A5C3MIA4_9AGAR|nr:hypothetical protein BDQ12DRAFT_49574 [Crucibulum laeve]